MLIFWLVLVGKMTRLFNALPTVHVVYRANLKAIGPALKVPHVGVIYFPLFKYTQPLHVLQRTSLGPTSPKTDPGDMYFNLMILCVLFC